MYTVCENLNWHHLHLYRREKWVISQNSRFYWHFKAMFTETQKSHGFHRIQLSKLREGNWKKNNHWIVDHRIDSFMFDIDEWWCDDPLAEQTRMSALLLLALSLNDRMDQWALSVLKTFNTQQINWWRRRRRRRRKKSTKLSFHVRRIFCLIKSDSIQCIEWKIWWMYVVVRCVCVCCWTWNSIKFHILSEISFVP